MEFHTTYEVRREDVNERLAKEWGIHEGLKGAFFLSRITRVRGSAPAEWVDITRVAVFNTNTEGDVFRTYLEDLHPAEEDR